MNNIPLNIDYQQIFLHLLNFTLLFAIMYFLLYKPVKNFMDKRQAHYEEMDRKAVTDLKEAEEKKTEYINKLEATEKEINEMRATAHKKIAEENERNIRLAKQEAEKILCDAREAAEAERNKALESCNDEIRHIVTDATEKLVLESTASDAYDQFLSAVRKGSDDDE